MTDLTRHQLGSLLLSSLRDEGMGVRDLFEGRQEPLSWLFRTVAYDQSELDILESGALDTLHAPSAMVELGVDELALGLLNVGLESLASYLAPPEGETESAAWEKLLAIDPQVMLGFVHVDVAPPALWLEERESSPLQDSEMAQRLSSIAESLAEVADGVEVHIEGAIVSDPEGGPPQHGGRPAGVMIHFTFEIPMLAGDEEEPDRYTNKRELAKVFSRAARATRDAVEGMRAVFRPAS